MAIGQVHEHVKIQKIEREFGFHWPCGLGKVHPNWEHSQIIEISRLAIMAS